MPQCLIHDLYNTIELCTLIYCGMFNFGYYASGNIFIVYTKNNVNPYSSSENGIYINIFF